MVIVSQARLYKSSTLMLYESTNTTMRGHRQKKLPATVKLNFVEGSRAWTYSTHPQG